MSSVEEVGGGGLGSVYPSQSTGLTLTLRDSIECSYAFTMSKAIEHVNEERAMKHNGK